MTSTQYQWSSHHEYMGELDWPEWLTTKELKSRLRGIGSYQRFIEGVMNGSLPPPDDFESVL